MGCYTALTHVHLHTHTLKHFDSRHSPSSKSPPSHLGSHWHSPISPFLRLKPLWHAHFLPLILLSLSVSSLSPSLPSLPQGYDGVLGYCEFFPLLSQQINRAGGADGCWQGVASSSTESCNGVPGKETLVFVFLKCNTTLTIGFIGFTYHSP